MQSSEPITIDYSHYLDSTEKPDLHLHYIFYKKEDTIETYVKPYFRDNRLYLEISRDGRVMIVSPGDPIAQNSIDLVDGYWLSINIGESVSIEITKNGVLSGWGGPALTIITNTHFTQKWYFEGNLHSSRSVKFATD
jgi:hypothetical protein